MHKIYRNRLAGKYRLICFPAYCCYRNSYLYTRKKQPYFAIKYGRIKKRRGHKKAIIAIARMMMVCIYHMVSEKKPFTPTDYEELIDSQNHVERVVLNESNVFAYLESFGYDSSKLVKRNDN